MSKKTEERYKSLPPGVRNNNYLNIKKSGDKWKGTRLPERNHPFVEFISPEWGYRAAFIIMAKSYRKRGITKIKDIIATWAPSSENNPAMYTATVVHLMSSINERAIDKDFMMPEPEGDAAKNLWCDLAYAMTQVEIGSGYGNFNTGQYISLGYDLFKQGQS